MSNLRNSKWTQEIYDNPNLFALHEIHCADKWRNLNHNNRLVTLVQQGTLTLEVIELFLMVNKKMDLLGTTYINPKTRLKEVCWFTRYEYKNILDNLYGQQIISNSRGLEECIIP